MSYSCIMREAEFRVKTENFEGILRKLISSKFAENVSLYRTHQIPEEMLAVCDKGSLGNLQWLLEQFFLDNGYALGYDGKANVVSITHVKDHWLDDTDFFDVFAEFVEKGSYIEMSGEDTAMWRMYFDGEHCHEINAVITWPGIDDMVKDKEPIDAQLLEAIEKDDEGFVANNIDDFFAYMFNEEWTFNELVGKLTPVMKEELIFGGKWNGDLGKADGKYYYHPDIDMLMDKPAVALGSRSDEEIAHYLGLEGEYEFRDEVIAAAKVVEAKYAGDSSIGYGLLCDFECTPYVLEDENDYSLEKIEEINGVVVYRKIEKEQSVDERIANATQICEDVNKDVVQKSDIELGKE